MTEKPRDFGLSGVTDKLKRFPAESEAVIQNKDYLNTGLTDKGKSDAVEPAEVLLDKDESEDMFDFRREALAKLDNPNVKVLKHAVETAKKKPRIGVYSPIVSAATEYLRETVPKYSASDEARKILEEEYEKRYPELVQRIKNRMMKGS
jgi:hypothetical protein